MPAKFKPTEKIVDRATKKVTVKHYYLKQVPQNELFSALNNDSTPNKKKQNIRNELIRRGVKIVRTSKQAGIC